MGCSENLGVSLSFEFYYIFMTNFFEHYPPPTPVPAPLCTSIILIEFEMRLGGLDVKKILLLTFSKLRFFLDRLRLRSRFMRQSRFFVTFEALRHLWIKILSKSCYESRSRLKIHVGNVLVSTIFLNVDYFLSAES